MFNKICNGGIIMSGKYLSKHEYNHIEMDSPETAKLLFINHYSDRHDIERFSVAFINNRNKLINIKDMFEGTIDTTLVYVRKILEEAELMGARAIIVAHNHPSGEISASLNDMIITKKLLETGYSAGISLIDHIIVGRNEAISFQEKGILNKLLSYDEHETSVTDEPFQIKDNKKPKNNNEKSITDRIKDAKEITGNNKNVREIHENKINR